NERYKVIKQIFFECSERLYFLTVKHIAGSAVVLHGPAIRQHDNHRRQLLLCIKIIKDDSRLSAAQPFSLVTADAVQQIQYRILAPFRVARWRIYQGSPAGAYCL